MAVLTYPSDEPGRPAAEPLERLQGVWLDVVASYAPHLGGLRDYLSSRLAGAAEANRADGARLLRIVDDAMERSRPSCAAPVAAALDRRLREAVYEHLLEMDAIHSLPAAEAEPPAILQLRTPSPPIGPPESQQEPAPQVAPPAPLPAPAPVIAPPAPIRAPEPAPAAAPPPVAPPPEPGWRVREQTPAGHRQSATPGGELSDARRRIGEWLHHKRYAEAAALVQRICAESDQPSAVELALDTAERCRGRGKAMAATSCYIAALRADPTNEQALLQLAEMCIESADLELAVSHLERIAQLALLRGDEGIALRMYRRIVTIAPHRDDILGLLMRTQMAMQDRNSHPRR